jgi:hypothetical protein
VPTCCRHIRLDRWLVINRDKSRKVGTLTNFLMSAFSGELETRQ